MIGTAFYVLGVIACMIVIVLAVLLAIAFFEQIVGVLGLVALIAFAWWMGITDVKISIREILVLAAFAAIIGGIWWLALRADKHNRELSAYNQRQRWAALDKSWDGGSNLKPKDQD
jgi:hypothetical protein